MTGRKGGGVQRRWFRVECVSYDPDYETYFGRLGRRQRHPEFRTRKSAMKYALFEVRAIEGMGLPARTWGPLPHHGVSGHIHVAALTTYSQVRKLFSSEELIRRYGSLNEPVEEADGLGSS